MEDDITPRDSLRDDTRLHLSNPLESLYKPTLMDYELAPGLMGDIEPTKLWIMIA